MRSFFLLILLLSCYLIQGQHDKYARARVSLIDKDVRTLSQLGIETDHGRIVKNRFIENDFSLDEINLIKSAGFDVDVIVDDIQAVYAQKDRPSEVNITGYRSGNCLSSSGNESLYDYITPVRYTSGSMQGYLTFDEMIEELDKMALAFPSLVSIRRPIGNFTTLDGNKLWYIKISDNPDTDEVDEKKVLYTALHHAREPNSMSQMIFYMWYLLENYQTNDEIKRYVNGIEMFFVPCVNPDGYKINEINKPNGGGLWRKNAKRDSTAKLIGVDLNRNYGHFWGFDNEGSSPNPNSETYRGDGPFSEVETSAIKYLCEQYPFEFTLNYHTYGNLLVHPWGYNDATTEEDLIFKTFGREMNKENNFKLGTGTETVGYVTNGDSDDWMYGDTTNKRKIYSFTPEVGPSFWPPASDIDFLNKSCLQLNLALPRLLSNYSTISAVDLPPFISKEASSMTFEVKKIGQNGDQIQVEIFGDNSQLTSTPFSNTLTMTTGQVNTIDFNFSLNENSLISGENVRFYTRLTFDGITVLDTIDLTYLKGDLTNILADEFSNSSRWISAYWAETPLVYFSATSSMTDSPTTTYTAGTSRILDLIDPIDLSDVEYAEISFEGKWAIEDDFDYVQVLASSNGVDFTPLCGKYTNAGTSDQKLGQPVFDGIQQDWVHEQMALEDFVGEKEVYIRFHLVSDAFLELDGFYFDDFKVDVINKPSTSTQHIISAKPIVSPNPANDEIFISAYGQNDSFMTRVYSTAGKLVTTFTGLGQFSTKDLNDGLYYMQSIANNGEIYQTKLVIVR